MYKFEVELGTRVKWKPYEALGNIVALGEEGITVSFDAKIPGITHNGGISDETTNGNLTGDMKKGNLLLFFDYPVANPVESMTYIDELEVVDDYTG